MKLETVTHSFFINGDCDVNANDIESREYSIKELRLKSQASLENVEKFYSPFRKTGHYNRMKVEKLVCMTKCPLDGEKWRKHPKYEVDVSNFGRIRSGNEILDQFEEKVPEGKSPHDGYLQVNIKDSLKGKIFVYELVAEAWLVIDKSRNCIWNVHHLNNNGYDNTPENLIKIPICQHKKIHPWLNVSFSSICINCEMREDK